MAVQSSAETTLKLEQFGTPLPDVVSLYIKERISSLLSKSRIDMFPGMQPVSLDKTSIHSIVNNDYFVAEKSDGLRILGYMTIKNTGEPVFCMTDRKYQFRELKMAFPIKVKNEPLTFGWHNDTLFDAELVADEDPSGHRKLRLLIFDVILLCGENVGKSDLFQRMNGILKKIIFPWNEYYKTRENLLKLYPFTVEQKEMFKSYHIAHLFNEVIPKLKHENDGLIFTPVHCPYTSGTCHSLFKWKPRNMNTVDFQIHIDCESGLNQQPIFSLLLMKRGEHSFFDYFTPDDDLIESWRMDMPYDKIGEFRFEVEKEEEESLPTHTSQERKLKGSWKFLRFRDDKTTANDAVVFTKIWKSIEDAVSKEQLISLSSSLKDNWSRREAEGKSRPNP